MSVVGGGGMPAVAGVMRMDRRNEVQADSLSLSLRVSSLRM
eukprot:CAMPEP_0185557736 /NCGR_PEP_ID=MMETSP1381-20130426/50556_1 /TAXON_ID=298111 /ORGANISM="Pavlova sp., Strain CCMP459" /LENGTH=40 /DNA_ID= /DNA_START= /DNA_END= /DNA_ORIENTATION=